MDPALQSELKYDLHQQEGDWIASSPRCTVLVVILLTPYVTKSDRLFPKLAV